MEKFDIKPLSLPYQFLLQRILSMHFVPENLACQIWNDIKTMPGCQGAGNQELGQALAIINHSIVPGFSLEVRSVSFKPFNHNDIINNYANEYDVRPEKKIIYHSVVNIEVDEIAKSSAFPDTPQRGHEMAYFRLIIETLVNLSVKKEVSVKNEKHKNAIGVGCQSSMSRMNMINLRTLLPEPHSGKISIGEADYAIGDLIEGGWLFPCMDFEKESCKPVIENKSYEENITTKKDMYLMIGPRTYMEIGELLVEFGLDRKFLPQTLFNG